MILPLLSRKGPFNVLPDSTNLRCGIRHRPSDVSITALFYLIYKKLYALACFLIVKKTTVNDQHAADINQMMTAKNVKTEKPNGFSYKKRKESASLFMVTFLFKIPADQDVSGPGAVFPSKIPPPTPPKTPTDTPPGSGISWPAGILTTSRYGRHFFPSTS